jgi:hypothetical protein
MRKATLIISFLLVAGLLVACGGSAPDVDWTLGLSGDASSPLTVGYAELVEMPQLELDQVLMEKSLGEDITGDWSGVFLDELLAEAGAGEYVIITAIADDGYTAETTLAEIQDCADCILSFRNQGGFSIVAPGFPGNMQVKGVVEIQVK